MANAIAKRIINGKASATEAKQAEQLLESARSLQTQFWDATRELEQYLDIEIDTNTDLEDQEIETLITGEV
jgi:hypothetical protein